MTTNAYFTNIKKHIKLELGKANESIYVAVAWFTDRSIFQILCDKAKAGVDVNLMVMDDSITRNCSINYTDIEDAGGNLYLINESYGTLMHNKFCIIDEQNIITGSYNWSIKASSNHENITITENSPALAITFINEFTRIKETYYGAETAKALDLSIVIKRFQIIDGLIDLAEYENIVSHLFKLRQYALTSELNEILSLLENGTWTIAQSKIKYFIANSQKIASYDSFKIEELRWKIKYLEIEILSLENEKSSILKIISDFVHEYNIRFGKYLIEILQLKAEKTKSQDTENSNSYQNAKDNYEKFKDNFEKEIEKEKNSEKLTSEEKEQLKKAYKKAARLCHPDMIMSRYGDNTELLEKASEIFKKLNEANERNDLNTVLEILYNLENGIFDFSLNVREPISKLEDIVKIYDSLRVKFEELTLEVKKLSEDKTYKQVLNIYDFDEFYDKEEKRLKFELEDLKN